MPALLAKSTAIRPRGVPRAARGTSASMDGETRARSDSSSADAARTAAANDSAHHRDRAGEPAAGRTQRPGRLRVGQPDRLTIARVDLELTPRAPRHRGDRTAKADLALWRSGWALAFAVPVTPTGRRCLMTAADTTALDKQRCDGVASVRRHHSFTAWRRYHSSAASNSSRRSLISFSRSAIISS